MIILKIILALTWEIPQSILAGFIYLFNFQNIYWINKYKLSTIIWVNREDSWGISLGRFIFLSKKFEDDEFIPKHEYGHTFQSLIFGPLYLFVIGITSLIRSRSNIKPFEYYNGYPEKWANNLAKISYTKTGWKYL